MKESTRPDTAPLRRTASAPLIAAMSTPVEASPVYFGPSERPLFGWLHDAGRASPGAVGLVICSPFGDEAIRTQRTIRHPDLASRKVRSR